MFLWFQSTEVKSSYHMEKEGLVRSVNFLQGEGIQIGTIITDRHVQIKKWIRENLCETKHSFDVWHVAKGIIIVIYMYDINVKCIYNGY